MCGAAFQDDIILWWYLDEELSFLGDRVIIWFYEGALIWHYKSTQKSKYLEQTPGTIQQKSVLVYYNGESELNIVTLAALDTVAKQHIRKTVERLGEII